ncbi:hypothetical protein CROQUDRAFT_718589 [Cronartium quercuum f. sp. fusiforme G11]|uniref:BZIP domain-containing protein n=1 Tax=Cronartium quercuum f. sp. fusiforme G11 TaxID=708437 RepID=A0A9P6T6L6_9BASI|nr:hypothetical protein CROQUDRAFT_718589 [Cronartium quercuum f. sp. fusiforme G11]
MVNACQLEPDGLEPPGLGINGSLWLEVCPLVVHAVELTNYNKRLDQQRPNFLLDATLFMKPYDMGWTYHPAQSDTSKEPSRKRKAPVEDEGQERRKQQNRVAQKAFRDRKDRYVREIESRLKCQQAHLQSMHDEKEFLQNKCEQLLERNRVLEDLNKRLLAVKPQPAALPQPELALFWPQIDQLNSANFFRPQALPQLPTLQPVFGFTADHNFNQPTLT